MKLYEGAWTDSNLYKLGGYFASPMDADTWVCLYTGSSWTVRKATASSDIVIGKLESEPQGDHVASSRDGTILLLGQWVGEVELHTSSDVVAIGEYVKFSTSGGKFGEGLFIKDDTAASGSSSGFLALASSSASGSVASGSLIPVLFGFRTGIQG